MPRYVTNTNTPNGNQTVTVTNVNAQQQAQQQQQQQKMKQSDSQSDSQSEQQQDRAAVSPQSVTPGVPSTHKAHHHVIPEPAAFLTALLGLPVAYLIARRKAKAKKVGEEEAKV